MANKFKKCAKAAVWTAAYCAELVAVAYVGTKVYERWNEGETSSLRYAVESTATILGAGALGGATFPFAFDAVADAVDEFTNSDDYELEFTEE